MSPPGKQAARSGEEQNSSLPVRRRSERKSVPDKKPREPLRSEAPAPPKTSVTARKIIPRKTQGSSLSGEADKENTVRRPSSSSPSSSSSQNIKNSEKHSPVRNRRDALNTSIRKSSCNNPPSENTLSPVASCPSGAGVPPNEDPQHQPDLVWSKKARRSYSRLSDGPPAGSPLAPRPDRLSLFGFGGLCGVSPVRGGGCSLPEGGGAGVSRTSPPAAERDFDIPGVALVKEKRRRRKRVEQIQMSELDCLAAQMNAEFDAAEQFDLCVE
ncbi:sororin isoform X2 [Polyodon spathula]|uniref:sororin isoform X2 n=1 Tax=Polyodon spathula TaxID=7913 RepID=UPI001B7F4397|nr:sororin isoform X2 [Polyodon spathula]